MQVLRPVRAQCGPDFPLPIAMPAYPPPPEKPSPPPPRITRPINQALPKFTNAELVIEKPVLTGLAALGLPELNLPEPPQDPNAPPPRRYRSPYEKPEPPPRPYAPAKPRNPNVIRWLNPAAPPARLEQREQFRLADSCSMTIYYGDITKWFVDGQTDAIVAPANRKLNGGPAVDGAIHAAAGSRLLSACQRLPNVGPRGVKCEVGSAVITRAFNLPVSRIIHAVGPVYEEGESDPVLEKTYIAALELAAKEGISSLAMPPLSCRVYGYPYSRGAQIALRSLKSRNGAFQQIDIVIRNREGYEAFVEEARSSLG